jgi:uncharacterized membrane protein YgdD (TMEM256/DUF423 family)
MTPLFVLIAALSGFVAVGLGAFAAHGLKVRLSVEALSTFQTGVQYQMYHALALLAVAILFRVLGHSWALLASGWLFVAGILLFSGSLYALALGGPRWLGPITPLGGLCFLLGWLALLVAAVRAVRL